MADYVWKALFVEFVGTFTLVFIGGSAVALTVGQGGSLLASAFAFGLALLTLIYMFSSYSGAHFNPAVSFGFAVAGQMNWLLMLGYWVAQLLGAITAAALIAYFYGTATGAGASIGYATNTDAWKAILMEAVLTFFLVMAYLLIYRNPGLALITGLAIGLVLTFAMLAGGPVSGASMNPARSLGPALFSNNMGTYWIYVVGPLLGALVAALVYWLLTKDWGCCNKLDACGKPILDECGRPLKECKRRVLDNCGKPVSDCNGDKYETYTKHDRKYTHMPETPLKAVGQWLSAHGFDPRYIAQEADRTMSQVNPSGVVQNPQGVVRSVLQSGAQGAAQLNQTPGVNTLAQGATQLGQTPGFNTNVLGQTPGFNTNTLGQSVGQLGQTPGFNTNQLMQTPSPVNTAPASPNFSSALTPQLPSPQNLSGGSTLQQGFNSLNQGLNQVGQALGQGTARAVTPPLA
jgi:MIP family channel proteins